MTLTEVLENGFLLPLMQEAWCRSWRQCVQTLPSTHALPHQAVPLEHLCRKEFLLHWSAHSLTIEQPRPSPEAQQCCFLLLWMGTAVPVAGQGLVPKSKDYCRHLTWWFSSFLSLQKMLLLLMFVCLFVCLLVCFHFMEVFHPNFFDFLSQDQIDLLKLGKNSLLCFLKNFCLTVFY